VGEFGYESGRPPVTKSDDALGPAEPGDRREPSAAARGPANDESPRQRARVGPTARPRMCFAPSTCMRTPPRAPQGCRLRTRTAVIRCPRSLYANPRGHAREAAEPCPPQKKETHADTSPQQEQRRRRGEHAGSRTGRPAHRVSRGLPRICALKRCRRRNRCFGAFGPGDVPCLHQHQGLARARYASALKRLGWDKPRVRGAQNTRLRQITNRIPAGARAFMVVAVNGAQQRGMRAANVK
jgi:hypothetical protein